MVERAKQQLQQDTHGIERALPNLADPFSEVLPDLVQDRSITPPDCHDTQSGAKQVYLDHLSRGVRQPSYCPKLSRPDRHATGLPKALHPGNVGVFESESSQQVSSLDVITTKNVDPT
jgi:hypothetical protein